MDRADPTLVATWLEGWTLSRGTPPPVVAFGGWKVEVGLPDQVRRFVFAAVDGGVGAAARANGEPHVFVKVCAPVETVRTVLPTGWEIVSSSHLMTTSLRNAVSLAPVAYAFTVERAGAAWQVTARDAGGRLAASGRVALPGGGAAVFDRIETDPAHRRRGLGRAIMSALGGVAAAEGASLGLLVATPDGRALYETLGWTVHAPYTSALWTAGANPISTAAASSRSAIGRRPGS